VRSPMPSPFPGMNPYLEDPNLWPSFHTKLIVDIANAIAPSLRPKYYVDVETRTYLDEDNTELLVGIPDALVLANAHPPAEPLFTSEVSTVVRAKPTTVRLPMPMEIRERYLEVREVGSDAVITVIEVLSPKNKRLGAGQTAYQKKRNLVLGSLSHLIEIDLLRGGAPMSMIGAPTQTHYRVLVSEAPKRSRADLYAFNLQDPIPAFPLPLKPDDAELVVDLQAIVSRVYELGSYDMRINYQQPAPPPTLSDRDQQWAIETLSDEESATR
jgi:Protein of unknown function (DUF4058)